MKFEIYVFTYKEPEEMVEKCINSIVESIRIFNIMEKIIPPIFVLSTNAEYVDYYLKKRFRNIKILKSRKIGKWRAVNLMIKNIKKTTDFIISVDSDCVISPGAIKIIYENMRKKNIGIVASVPVINCKSFKENVFRVFQEIAIYRSLKRQKERGYCGTIIEPLWALKKEVLRPMPDNWINEVDWFSRVCREKKMVQIIDKKLYYKTRPISSFVEMVKVKRRILKAGYSHGGMDIEGEFSHLNRLKETLEYSIKNTKDVPYIIVACILEAIISLYTMISKEEKWYTAMSPRRIHSAQRIYQ